MWSSLFFAAALAARPSLVDVDVGWDGETMGVTALASAPLAPESARASFLGRSLQIRLSGASLDAPERTFGRDSGAPVSARRTAEGIELQVPIGNRLDCKGPVEITAAGNGLAASLRCTLKGAGPVPVAGERSASSEAEKAPKAQASTPPEQLRSMVQLPADPPKAKSPEAPAAEALPPKPLLNSAPSADSARSEAQPQGSSSWGLGLGAVLALGAGALFAVKRRARSPRIVNIVETAALGPKRSLVIAKVGSETLLLGTSEAGISLLTTVHGDPSLTAAEDALAAGLSPADLEAELDRLEPVAAPPPAGGAALEPKASEGQASLLDRLLSHKPQKPQVSFESLLAESAEDRDLRRKLEAGMTGRVS